MFLENAQLFVRDIKRKLVMEKRFSVGSSDGPRSSVWKLWTTNKSEVYLLVRDAGGLMHISLHQSGRCHVTTTSSFADALKNAGSPLWPYLDVWTPESNLHAGFTLAFRIAIPASQLRTMPFSEGKYVIWLSPPRQGFTAEIAVLFTDFRVEPDGWPGQYSQGTKLVLHYPLPNGKVLWVVYREYRDEEGTLQRIAKMRTDLLNHAPTWVTKDDDRVNLAMSRLLLGGEELDGSRSVIDIAGDTVFSTAAKPVSGGEA